MSFHSSLDLPLWVGMTISAVLSLGWLTMAEDTQLDTGPRLLPYQGHLDMDGVPYEGTVDLRMTLSNNAGETWTEDHSDVALAEGRFGVALGSTSDGLPDWFFNTTDAFLRLEVRDGSSDGEYTALGGVQELHASPATYWAAEGHDFQVRGAMTSTGSLVVSGLAEADSLEVDEMSVTTLNFTGAGGVAFGHGTQAGKLFYQRGEAGNILQLQAPGGDNDSLSLVLGGASLLKMEAGVLSFGEDMTLAGGARAVVRGEFTNANRDPDNVRFLIHSEGEVASVSSADEVVDVADASGNRLCVLSDTSSKINSVRACKTSVSGGDFELSSVGTSGNLTCTSACGTW